MLVVSRPLDVACDELQNFDSDERFIKLPIEGYLRLLYWDNQCVYDSLNRPQRALINAVNNPKFRFVCAALSRRTGKTLISNIIAQLVALVPGCNILIISPNYNLSSISFDLQRKLIKNFDLEVEKNNLKDRVIELPNGSTIRMGSVSTVDSCVGRSYSIIIFDEAALDAAGEEAFNVALRPTLDKPNSKAIFISTPRGKTNWFSKFWLRGFSEDYPQWVSLQADYLENPRMTEADVAEARKSMSKAEFEQEYCASFTSFEGQIYSLPDTQVVEYVGGDRHEALAGLDPGFRDPTAFVSIIYKADVDKFHIVDEYLKSEATTPQHADAFKEQIAKWNIDPIYCDPAAPQFMSDLANLYDISTIKAKKDVLEGIAYVQTLIEQGRLEVAPHCTECLRMFDQYKWDTAETAKQEKPKHDGSKGVVHMADAVRYALYTYTL
jgi:hypothetical protein